MTLCPADYDGNWAYARWPAQWRAIGERRSISVPVTRSCTICWRGVNSATTSEIGQATHTVIQNTMGE